MATISLRVITNGPVARTAAILGLYRGVVDEIVVVVNGLFRPLELAPLWAVADQVIPVQMTPEFTAGRYRPWLTLTATTDWVAFIDHDEVPSQALLDGVGAAAQWDHVAHVSGPRRWLYPDPSRYLDQPPWEPNLKMLLARPGPLTRCLRAGVHVDYPIIPPYRHTELAAYHLVLLTASRAQREAKVAHYDALGRGSPPPPGFANPDYYLPEGRSALTAQVPPADQALIAGVLARTSAADRVIDRRERPGTPTDWLPGTLAWADIEPSWPGRAISATSAEFSLVPSQGSALPPRMPAGGQVVLLVRVRNTSPLTWPREGGHPVLRIGARWARPDGTWDQPEARSPLGADVRPGEVVVEPLALTAPAVPGTYLLNLGLVQEHVQWFAAGMVAPVEVVPAGRPQGCAGTSGIGPGVPAG